jgi:chemotaxis signal transduction protein
MTQTSTLAATATQVAKAIEFHLATGKDFMEAAAATAQEVLEVLVVDKGWAIPAARQAALGVVADVIGAMDALAA